MKTPNQERFSHLSLNDLIQARDLFHAHLINKRNVVATAVGRYLIRKSDLDDNGKYLDVIGRKEPRTLQNSVVIDLSWPCILVFVKEWEEESKLLSPEATDIIPKSIYMPDGGIVPICVVKAEKNSVSDSNIRINKLRFPSNYIGGGFPLLIPIQGTERVASVGCIVTDGHKYYALTNKHVTGDKGQEIFSKFGSIRKRIGISSGINIGKMPFSFLYPGWENKHTLVNCDAGLVEIDNINQWKTSIIGHGEMGEMYDLNTLNLGLNLITQYSKKNGLLKSEENANVIAFGAVGGSMEGEIVALFYRYKSVGGTEYVTDFLIGGRDGKELNVFHGDSGTIWLMETFERDQNNNLMKVSHPLAIHWGQHEIIDDNVHKQFNYSMAASLSNICRVLEVDLVRGWNIDNDYSWAKTGHFKIAARACDLTSDDYLDKLLKANKINIGYDDDTLKSGEGLAMAKTEKFIPLADVPDLWWRYKRPRTEGSNHFADMDETNSKVMNGKSLLKLCNDDKNIDIDVWTKFYEEMDKVDPKTKVNYSGVEEPAPRLGSLPFRVWQMFDLMVEAVEEGNVDKFICLGGTLSHYVGDACQPLHSSYLHAGIPGQETKVHSDYEDSLIFKNAEALFIGVNDVNKKVKDKDLIKKGKDAAKLTIELMRQTFKSLSPMTIIKCFEKNTGRGKYEKAWKELGPATIDVIANGCYTMAVLWQSAWIEGQKKSGKKIPKSKLKTIDEGILKDLYINYHFAQSYIITDPKFKNELK